MSEITRSEAAVLCQVIRLCRLRVAQHYLPKLLTCLDALEQVELATADAAGNSIEGTVRHMLAHLDLYCRQSGMTENLDRVVNNTRGIEDCFPESGMTKEELGCQAKRAFGAFDDTLVRLQRLVTLEETPGSSLEEVVDLGRLLHVVEHLSYHLGQIVLATRSRTGREFSFVQAGLNEAQLRALATEEKEKQCHVRADPKVR